MEDGIEKLDAAIEAMAEQIRTDSIKTGAKLVCSVVIQKAHEDKPCEDRLNDIVQFCALTLGKVDEDR